MTIEIRKPSVVKKLPKAVIFDTDNTLYPYNFSHKCATHAVEKKAEKLLGINKEEFSTAYLISRKEIKSRLGDTASSHSRLLYFQRTLEILGLETQVMITLDLEQTYWRTFLSNIRLFPSVKEYIQDLRAQGIRSAVVTDLTAQIQFRKLVYFGLHESFDYIVTSEEAGADKPSYQPFQLALDKLGVLASDDIWMIGDHPVKDIQGARDTINAVTFQKRHDDIQVLQGAHGPDIVFDDYDELRRLLNKITNKEFEENYISSPYEVALIM